MSLSVPFDYPEVRAHIEAFNGDPSGLAPSLVQVVDGTTDDPAYRIYLLTALYDLLTEKYKANKVDYAFYIGSKVWRAKRYLILEINNRKCRLCGRTPEYGLNVHHNNYNNLGNELLEDLTVLCEDCHVEYHKYKKAQLRLDKEIAKELKQWL